MNRISKGRERQGGGGWVQGTGKKLKGGIRWHDRKDYRANSEDLVKSQLNDGFDCGGVRPDAHYRASTTRPYMPDAQKLGEGFGYKVQGEEENRKPGSCLHPTPYPLSEVAAQRRRWTFYEPINFLSSRAHR
jgi:hypothetical protein